MKSDLQNYIGGVTYGEDSLAQRDWCENILKREYTMQRGGIDFVSSLSEGEKQEEESDRSLPVVVK